MSKRRTIAYAAALAAAAPLLASATAAACPATPPVCSSLPGPILYMESGDTQQTLIKRLGRKLRDSPMRPMTVVYNLTGSCTLTQDMFSANKLKVNLSYIPSTAEDAAWTTKSAACTCTPDAAGDPIGLAISALFVASCNLGAPPMGLGVIDGPKQGYGMVVPTASDQQAIVAEEAYFTFGFGQAGMIMPWNNEMQMFIRPATKSTLLSIAANIGVPAAKWHGVAENASTDVVNAVSTSATPEQAIGILGVDVYDANRATLKMLAYRAYQQNYAYWPDDSATAFDKRNVRDGHYTIWSPTQYVAAVDANNVPTDPNAKYWVDLVLGDTPSPATDVDGLAAVSAVGLVPDCAMKVSRTADGGPLALYSPAAPCGCFFESNTGPMPMAPASCTACMSDATCNGGHCRHGYCEAN
jgi:hypothetical protein